MTTSTHRLLAVAVLLAACTGSAAAIQTCDLDGRPVNPNNGGTTEGRTGVMRCRDADTGALVREQELRAGKFVGLVRHYENGQLKLEYTANERGNRDGITREWQVGAAGTKPVLVREETARDGTTIGVSRSWTSAGLPKRLTFYGDGGPEQGYVEFADDGRPRGLRCAKQPVFGKEFDDRVACGFDGAAVTTVLYARGRPSERVTYERGVRTKSESLWDNGAVRDVRETSATGAITRSFAADGTKRRETQAVASATASASGAPRYVDVLDQEYHEAGQLVHERRWQPADRGAELVAETHWYLNGQLKDRTQYVGGDGRQVRRETTYHDNGQMASDGTWVIADARRDRYGVPAGVHKTFDDGGRAVAESVYDDRGRLVHERRFDARGTLVRDDDVFEDGSQKAVGR